MRIKTSWPQTTELAPPSWSPNHPAGPRCGTPRGPCLAMSRTIIADPSLALAFFDGDVEVGEEVGLCRVVDFEGEFCGQWAAQCPTWPHLRQRVALARCGICPPLLTQVLVLFEGLGLRLGFSAAFGLWRSWALWHRGTSSRSTSISQGHNREKSSRGFQVCHLATGIKIRCKRIFIVLLGLPVGLIGDINLLIGGIGLLLVLVVLVVGIIPRLVELDVVEVLVVDHVVILRLVEVLGDVALLSSSPTVRWSIAFATPRSVSILALVVLPKQEVHCLRHSLLRIVRSSSLYELLLFLR